MPLNWQTWCRLCGKIEVDDAVIKMESIPNLIVLVQKHFNITVSSICIVNNNNLIVSMTPNNFAFASFFIHSLFFETVV